MIKDIYQKYGEIINYLVVGALTVLVTLIIYYGCTKWFLNPANSFELQVSNVISWLGAVIFAYFANRKYVFKSQNTNILKESSKFFTSRILTLVIDMLFMFITVTKLGLNDKIMKLFSNIIVIILNYIISKLYVFIKK